MEVNSASGNNSFKSDLYTLSSSDLFTLVIFIGIFSFKKFNFWIILRVIIIKLYDTKKYLGLASHNSDIKLITSFKDKLSGPVRVKAPVLFFFDQ